MKMRTMICCMIIFVAQLYSVSCYAYTRVTHSGTNETVVIKGDGYSPYETVPVMILKAGKNLTDLENATSDTPNDAISDVVGYMCSLSADKDGNVNNEIPLTGFVPGYNYGVVVNGILYDIDYVANADRNTVIASMISAADHNDSATLQALFSANKHSLSIDNNLLNACSSVSDASVAAILMKEIKGKGTLTIDQMSEALNKTMLVAALNADKLNSLGDKDIIDHILYSGKYFDANSALKDKIKLTGLNNFISRINNHAYTSVSDAETGITKELILNALCYSKIETTTELLSLLEKHNDVLGLNLTGFNLLSEGNKGNAIRSFANRKPTLATMQSTLNSIVAELRSSETPINQNNSGGGGGGGGSAKGDYIGMQSPTSGTASEAPGYAYGDNNSGGSEEISGTAFNDLDGYPWAYEAITSLYKAGIISGYGNGRFEPQNNIKREEFVTIAVAAFYKDADAEACSFSDVSEEAWYYKNIAVGASNGIINGMDDNSFGVGKNITRQDIAVILYRIADDKLEKPENYNLFSDDEDIADYAKEAVYALRAAGVINGVSDSEFAPAKNATRAETAVMVYRFLSLIEKEGV